MFSKKLKKPLIEKSDTSARESVDIAHLGIEIQLNKTAETSIDYPKGRTSIAQSSFSRRRSLPDLHTNMTKSFRKPTIKKGVHCSIIRSTSTKSERHINPKSSKSTTNFEWRRSTSNALKDFSPRYAANNFTTTLLRIKKHGLGRKSKKETIPNDEDEETVKIEEEEEEEKVALTKLITDRKKALPMNSQYFDSCHNIINRERCKRNTLPLYRNIQLDRLATVQAKIMAAQQCRVHSDLDALMSKVIMSGPCRIVGENVCRGSSIQFIHKKMMHSPKCAADKRNFLDRRYSSFGVGAAQCVDGVLYICQIYKG